MTFIYLFVLAVFLILPFAIFVAVFVFLYRWKKGQQDWLQKFAPQNKQYTRCHLGYIDRDRIANKNVNAKKIQGITTAMLFYGENWARCAIFDNNCQDRVKVLDFDGNSQLALLTLHSRIFNLPPLIRWIQDDRSYYFVATYPIGMMDVGKTKTLFAELAPHFHGREIHYGKPKPWVKQLALFILAIVLCFVANALFTGYHLPFQTGVEFVDIAPSGDIFVVSPKNLYHLDASGRLQNRYVLQDLGIKQGIADIQASDRHEIFLADWNTGSIQRCQLHRQNCQPLSSFNTTFAGTFKLKVDRQHELIYATDTARHRLVTLTMDGEEIESTRSWEILLCFPHGIALSREGKVVVADSNNFRVVTWSVNRQGLELTPEQQIDFVQSPRSHTKCIPSEKPSPRNPLFREFQTLFRGNRNDGTQAHPIALDVAQWGRAFPTSIEQDRFGFWWVLVGDRNLARDNVLRFDSNWENPQRVKLSGQAEISHLAVGRDRVFITLPKQYNLLSISMDNLRFQSFGDRAFQKAMQDEQRAEFDLYQSYLWSLVFASFGFILLIFLAFWETQQKLLDLARLDPTI